MMEAHVNFVAVVRETKRQLIAVGLSFFMAALVALIGFYFRTQFVIDQHTQQLETVQKDLQNRATWADVQLLRNDLERLNHKTDKILELMVKNNSK